MLLTTLLSGALSISDADVPLQQPEPSGYTIQQEQLTDIKDFGVLKGSEGEAVIIVGESRAEEEARQEAERIARERVLVAKSTLGAYDVEMLADANVEPETTVNLYKDGNCTWWVKNQRQETPNRLGNAKNWTINSDTPEVGGVVVTNESPLGHVAYITAVEGNYIEVSEMNYVGLYVVNKRVLNWHSGVVQGFLI